MSFQGIDFGTKAAIVGVAIAIALAMRAAERYAHMRARKHTRDALERSLSR